MTTPANYKDNARFCKVYPHVLSAEGGYVFDYHDPGGATNHGIAYNYNVGWVKKYGITLPTEMKKLTQEQALEIYYAKYWLPSQADEIPDTRLAMAYFDHAVNAGTGAADQLLAKLGTQFWRFEGGGKNVNYFWGLTVQYMLHRLWFYAHIRNWGLYGLGWFNRLVNLSRVLATL